MRVLHIAPLDVIVQNHLLTLLPYLRKHGVKTELLVLFDQHPPSPVLMAGMKRGGVPMYGLKLPHLADLVHPTTPQSIMEVAQFIGSRHADIVHTHLMTGDFLGGYGARWAHIEARVSTRYDLSEDRSAEHWRVVAGLFKCHIITSPTLADTVIGEGAIPEHVVPMSEDLFAFHTQIYRHILRG